MKQILQNLKTGETLLAEVPRPQIKPGQVLIRTRASLISAGTERMLMEFGRAGWVDKARQQPDKVRQVLAKVKTDGLMATMEAVQAKLDQPLPLGYCNAGVVIAVGGDSAALGFSPGDRVVSNGPHAEVACVPKNLCARIPDGVPDADAAFTVLGAIALQGVRLAEPTLGESFVVLGLGLIGLMTVQLLLANGCRVLGIDLEASKCDQARQFGAEVVNLSQAGEPQAAALNFSRGRGVDGVIITAATKSSTPVHQAAEMCRKRGRIILSGVTGLELRRDDFYKKELSFQVSCSYGPGRYDPEYEDKGHDYPLGFVRWTEQRNLEAVLDLMAAGKLITAPLISHRYPMAEATQAYDMMAGGREPYIGILLEYGEAGKEPAWESALSLLAGEDAEALPVSTIALGDSRPEGRSPEPATVGLIGAGNFTGQVILPALQKTNARLKTIASATGVSAAHLGKKFGFLEASTDTHKIITDPEIDTIFITTRHHTHGRLALAALQAGKNVFVEKPLCLEPEELDRIEETMAEMAAAAGTAGRSGPILMVGFNRRFAPHIQRIKTLLAGGGEPVAMVMTVNAGMIPPDHWTQDPEVGGGRVIGEACHFVDLLRYLADSPIVDVAATYMGQDGPQDTLSLTLSFANGSVGTVHYFANGNKTYPKERLEVFGGGKVLQLDNFRSLMGWGWPRFRKMQLWRQNKGHGAEIAAFIEAVRTGGPPPIPLAEIAEVTRATFTIASTGESR